MSRHRDIQPEFSFVRQYLEKEDKFLLNNTNWESEPGTYQTRSDILDSTNPGLLELDEFFHPKHHHSFKRTRNVVNCSLAHSKEPPKRMIKLNDLASKQLSSKTSSENSYHKKITRQYSLSRFNLDPQHQVCFSPHSNTPKAMNLGEGTYKYSQHRRVEPFSLGEVNLIGAAAEESCLSQAIQLTMFFSSSQLSYPEPSLLLDLLAGCIELVKELFPLENNSLVSYSYKDLFLPGEKEPDSLPSTEIVMSLAPKLEEVGKALCEMARLLRHLSTYLDMKFFRDVFSPLAHTSTKFSSNIKSQKDGSFLNKVGSDFWNWLSILGQVHSDDRCLESPEILHLGTGQLMNQITSILELELRDCGVESIPDCLLSRLLPGEKIFPYTKLETVASAVFNCRYNSQIGLPWLNAMFHLHHLLVLLTYTNVIDSSSLLNLTAKHFSRLPSCSRDQFIGSIISLPFRCQAIDFILRTDLKVFMASSGGWLDWYTLADTYMTIPFTSVFQAMLRKHKVSISVFSGKRLPEEFNLSPAVSQKLGQESKGYLSLLSHALFGYFFYRTNIQPPTEDLQPGARFITDNTQASQLKRWLSDMLPTVHQVEVFLDPFLPEPSFLVEQFKSELLNFPFPCITSSQVPLQQ